MFFTLFPLKFLVKEIRFGICSEGRWTDFLLKQCQKRAMLNLNPLYNGERWCFDGGVSQPFLMLRFLFDKVQLQIFLQGNFRMLLTDLDENKMVNVFS